MKHRCAFSYFNKKPTHKLVVVFLLCRSTVEQNMDLTVMSQLVSQRRGIKWDMRKWGLTWTFFAICCHAIKFYLTGSLSVSSKLDERTWSLADKTKKKKHDSSLKKKIDPVWVSELSSWFACCFRLFLYVVFDIIIIRGIFCVCYYKEDDLYESWRVGFTLNLSTIILITIKRPILKDLNSAELHKPQCWNIVMYLTDEKRTCT